jgi:serine/threonine protein kinase
MTDNKRRARRNKHKRTAGVVIGGWKLVRLLGQGGNGEVWEVSKDGFDNHAMKLLKSTNEVTYERFKAEAHVLSSYDIEGIIDLIELNLPDDLSIDTPWYVMPIAENFEEYTEGKSPLEIATQFILLADTLSELHLNEISHRDIKPANILFYKERLYFADFGLVKYPEKDNMTPEKRDVGAKFTMAPEMRREAYAANGKPADVYSLAKSLWISLTKNEKGFDGQYNPTSTLSVKNYCEKIYTTSLDNLLVECTDNSPSNRPTAQSFSCRLQEWIDLNNDFHTRNLLEWLELQKVIFPTGTPAQATWTDIDSICAVLHEISKTDNLNHMFYPTGGGNDLIGTSKATEEGMIALHVCEKSAEIIKPKKLTYESFGYHPQWNYFRLELEEIEPTHVEGAVNEECTREALLEIEPGEYVEYYHWDHGEYNGNPLPDTARIVDRFLKGAFVFFSKRSIYNRINETYDGRHNKVSELEFRDSMSDAAKQCHEHDVA